MGSILSNPPVPRKPKFIFIVLNGKFRLTIENYNDIGKGCIKTQKPNH